MKIKLTLMLIVSIIIAASCIIPAQSKEKKNSTAKSKVTFIELGSVNCIPCKMMQPVMKNIEKKYGGQVKVTFYDVWTQEQRQYAEKYRIRVIPTQVFLDENGKEFHRHEGFYPEEEIDKILKEKGLKPNNAKS